MYEQKNIYITNNGGHHDFNYLIYLFLYSTHQLKDINATCKTAKGRWRCRIWYSKFLAITHVLIYMSAAIEAFIRKDTFSLLNGIGLIILIIAYIMLFIVIKTLGRIWTLKLFILPNHPIIKSGLYKVTKHPNYFLNIIPELIGVLLLTHATYTTLLLVPYAYFLIVRIRQEEKLMNI